MNTKMLMLGILLIAGLSFARITPDNWMTHVETRYYCDEMYSAKGYSEEMPGLSYIAFSDYDFDTEYACIDERAMDGYLDAMDAAIREEDGMCDNSGCNLGEPSATGFRSNMLYYNTNAAQFKALFLQGVRACMAGHPTEYPRATVAGWLNSAKAGYLACLSEEGLCDSCESG